VVLVFLAWRIFIFSFPTYKPVLLQELRARPLVGLLHLGQSAGRDLWTALAAAWLQTLHFPDGRRTLLVYLALAAGGLGLVWLLWRHLWKAKDLPAGRQVWGEIAFGIGLAAMLAGGSIFWLTGIPVSLEFPWDRSTLPFMLGACLALTGLIEMAFTPRYRPVVAAGLVALAIGMHFANAQEYRAEWQKLQDFYWQLTWRAPQLEPGTLLMFDVIPLNRYSDNDMTAFINWTYAPASHSNQIAYKFFDLNLRLDTDYAGLPGLEKDLPVEIAHRGVMFKSMTGSSLAVMYNPPACLKILAPDDVSLPGVTDRLAKVLPMTRLEQVRASVDPVRPPAQLGPEPAHGWCYYFQKAELARQQQDYARVATLADQAFSAPATAGPAPAGKIYPGDPAELLPFIEGYALSGNPEQAQALSQEAGKQARLRPALCNVWQQISAAASPGTTVQDTARNVRSELNCPP
jgi:hypothetical protein